MKKFLLLLAIALAFNTLAHSQRIYVRSNAAGANDGSSWSNAFSDLQAALAVAQPGDSVWVAQGTYFPTSTTDRTISFSVKSGVRLFGGFAGTETTLAERDWDAHPVVLSGAIGSIFAVDNSLHIVYLESPDSNTVLDGLRFTKGVEDADTTNRGGAAIFVWARDTIGTPVSAARIRNCRFEDNSSVWFGGAVRIDCYGTDRTRFERCTFLQNDARYGGAVGISAAETRAEWIDCHFTTNESVEGGGAVRIGAPFSAARFSGCLFEKNRSKDAGGGAVHHTGRGLAGSGVAFSDCDFFENVCEGNDFQGSGAIYIGAWGGSDTLAVEYCDFFKNTGGVSGVFIEISDTEGTNTAFRHCTFEENGKLAIWMAGSNGSDRIRSLVLSHCTILKNKGEPVAVSGSAPLLQQTHIRIDSCRSEDNLNGRMSFNIEGDALLDISNSIFSRNANGEVLSAFISQIFLTNCVVQENKGYWLFNWEDGALHLRNCLFRKNQTQDFLFAVNFGALHAVNCQFDKNAPTVDYPFPFFQAEATVVNSVFTGNTGTTYAIPSYLNPHFSHCYFGAPLNNPPATLTFGPGILTGPDPMFADLAAGDFHVQPCSPLVGAGDNTAVAGLPFDPDGAPRLQGGAVDIGLFERAAPGLAAAPAIQLPCAGGQNGAITFQPANGCEPYVFAWSSGAASGQNLTGLAAGDYVFSITDARGSVSALPVTIPVKPAPALVPAVEPVHCGDTSGGSVALAADGTAPFTFLWPDGGADTLRSNLAAGMYPVQTTDADGCTGIDTVRVGTQGRLKAALSIEKISCPGYADGSLSIAPGNGLAPFGWLWHTGDTTASLNGLGPGWYGVTLTDALGCSLAWKIPMTEPDTDCKTATAEVFPNPFSSFLTIYTEEIPGSDAQWVLIDPLGRTAAKVALEDIRTTLHVPDLPPGVYGWHLTQGGRVVKTGKLSKH